MTPRTPAPPNEIEDTSDDGSDGSSGPYNGREIPFGVGGRAVGNTVQDLRLGWPSEFHVSNHPSPNVPLSSTARESLSAGPPRDDLASDPAGISPIERGRQGAQVRQISDTSPEQLLARWHAKHPEEVPDPAIQCKSYARTKGRPTKAVDIFGKEMSIQFYRLLVYRDWGVWVLTDSLGRRRIVQRKGLGKKVHLLLSGDRVGDDPHREDSEGSSKAYEGSALTDDFATSGFFEWLERNEKFIFESDACGYIVPGSLDTSAIVDEDLELLPELSSSFNTADASGSRVPISNKDPSDMKHISASPDPNLERDKRRRNAPTSYKVDTNSFQKSDDSLRKRNKRRRSSRTSSNSGRATRGATKISSSRSETRSEATLSATSVLPPRPSELPKEPRKSTLVNGHFKFMIDDRGAFLRPVDMCNNIVDFFRQVQKAAKVAGEPENQNAVMCKLTWQLNEVDYGIMKDDEDDLLVILEKMKECPRGESCVVEVRRLK